MIIRAKHGKERVMFRIFRELWNILHPREAARRQIDAENMEITREVTSSLARGNPAICEGLYATADDLEQERKDARRFHFDW